MNENQRKQMLIAQGALHRTEVLLARESVRASLRPAVLAKEALPGMAMAALTAWLGSGAAGLAGKLPALPLAMRAFGLLRAVGATSAIGAMAALASRTGSRTLILRLTLAGALVGAAYVYLKRK